eukprot:1151620-Pyramimonas_sp.AAC.2
MTCTQDTSPALSWHDYLLHSISGMPPAVTTVPPPLSPEPGSEPQPQHVAPIQHVTLPSRQTPPDDRPQTLCNEGFGGRGG